MESDSDTQPPSGGGSAPDVKESAEGDKDMQIKRRQPKRIQIDMDSSPKGIASYYPFDFELL